ncbi:hypothetical protein HDU89_001011 [Geranomyces variabilis]|nr:hypothetical protein HDU89_001011 [Geranomyces variabilis]
MCLNPPVRPSIKKLVPSAFTFALNLHTTLSLFTVLLAHTQYKMAIKNVVLIGAGGNLGPAVLKGLLGANFTVTILARSDSKSTFPTGIAVRRTDYTPASLLAAFEGQDAVVSTIGAGGLAQQNDVVDAAAKAGVQRFIPSEFGSNTTNQKTLDTVPLFQGKVDHVAHLKSVAESHPGFTWTSIITGGFFDWGLQVGFLGYDLHNQKATIYDSGDRRSSVSTLAQIGRAVAATLTHPTETANKYIFVNSFTLTQNETLAALESATGHKFTVTRRTTADANKAGMEKLAKGDIENAVADLILSGFYGEGTGNDFENDVEGGTSNKVLGLPTEKLDEVIKQVLAGK